MALAHTVSDKTVAAYNRTDLFDRRRQLMQQWGNYCEVRGVRLQNGIAPIRRKGLGATFGV